MKNKDFLQQFQLFDLTCALHGNQISFYVKNKQSHKYLGNKFSQDTLPNLLKSLIDHIQDIYDYLQQNPQFIRFDENSLFLGIKTGLVRSKQVQFPLQILTEIPNQLLLKQNEKLVAREAKLIQRIQKLQVNYKKKCLEVQQILQQKEQTKKILEDKTKLINYLQQQNTKINIRIEQQMRKLMQQNRMKSQKIRTLEICYQKQKQKLERYQLNHKEACIKNYQLQEKILKLQRQKKQMSTQIYLNQSQIFNMHKQLQALKIYSFKLNIIKSNCQIQTEASNQDQNIYESVQDNFLKSSLVASVTEQSYEEQEEEQNQQQLRPRQSTTTSSNSYGQHVDMKFNLKSYSKDIQAFYQKNNILGPFNNIQQILLQGQTKIYPTGIQRLQVKILNCSKCNFILGLNAVSQTKQYQSQKHRIYFRSDGKVALNDRRSQKNMQKHKMLQNQDMVVFQMNFIKEQLLIFVNAQVIETLVLPRRFKVQKLQYYDYYVRLSGDAQVKIL